MESLGVGRERVEVEVVIRFSIFERFNFQPVLSLPELISSYRAGRVMIAELWISKRERDWLMKDNERYERGVIENA